jgi:predicted esterase
LTTTDPHAGQQILRLGPVPEAARLTVICIHGRGAAADDMLGLARELQIADVAFLAPQAANNTWYPYSFLTPIEKNEPWLTSALTAVDRLVAALGAQGVTGDRVALMGFSQGACLTLEFSARNPRRYAAVIALSGGLIGPPGRRRCAHSRRTRARVGRGDAHAGRARGRADLSADGTHRQQRRAGRGQVAARSRAGAGYLRTMSAVSVVTKPPAA